MISNILERVTPLVESILEDIIPEDEMLEWNVGAITEPYMTIDEDSGDMSVGMEQYVAIWLLLHEDEGDSALTTKVTIPMHLATDEHIQEALTHIWNHLIVSRMEHQFSEIGD